MKVAQLLEQRKENWKELDELCTQLETKRRRSIGAAAILRFATLYRAACADLALANAYQLPPKTVQYLHRLVGRAHNQLYRSRAFDIPTWSRVLFTEIPPRIFNDRCVQLTFVLFWGVFVLSAGLAVSQAAWPDYANEIIGSDMLDQMLESFQDPIRGRDPGANPVMASFYIRHNTSIGLRCFVMGLLVIPGLLETGFNAAFLGAVFGYMARPDVAEGENFFHFVTAHGPFELTAIVLAAGAGLRLGMSWIKTSGLTRISSLQKTAKESMPLMGAAMLMFFMAAIIEGFLSPSSAPYGVKAAVAIFSSGLLMFYFVVLGYAQRTQVADAV